MGQDVWICEDKCQAATSGHWCQEKHRREVWNREGLHPDAPQSTWRVADPAVELGLWDLPVSHEVRQRGEWSGCMQGGGGSTLIMTQFPM